MLGLPQNEDQIAFFFFFFNNVPEAIRIKRSLAFLIKRVSMTFLFSVDILTTSKLSTRL